MQLKCYFVVIVLIINNNNIFGQLNKSFRAMEGFIIYDKKVIFDSIPCDVIFVPAKINYKLNLFQNLKSLNDSEVEGHFMYFQNIRHTQYFLENISLHKPLLVDTVHFLSMGSLKDAIKKSDKYSTNCYNYPSSIPRGDPETCSVVVSIGCIIFDNSESTMSILLDREMIRKEKIVKETVLLVGRKKKRIKYTQFGYANMFGMGNYFFPYKTNQEN